MNTTGKFRREPLDSKEIGQLDQLYFPRPWKTHDWESLEVENHRLWAWTEDHQILGFALFHVAPSDDTAHLLKILVRPEVRGSGEADQFWKAIIQSLKDEGIQQIYLEVEESNKRAQRFYERQGFQVLRRVKSYYSDGEGAVMMQLTL